MVTFSAALAVWLPVALSSAVVLPSGKWMVWPASLISSWLKATSPFESFTTSNTTTSLPFSFEALSVKDIVCVPSASEGVNFSVTETTLPPAIRGLLDSLSISVPVISYSSPGFSCVYVTSSRIVTCSSAFAMWSMVSESFAKVPPEGLSVTSTVWPSSLRSLCSATTIPPEESSSYATRNFPPRPAVLNVNVTLTAPLDFSGLNDTVAVTSFPSYRSALPVSLSISVPVAM